MQEYTPAALAAYLRRTPVQAMREAIEEYEAGHITIGELESKLIFLVEREKNEQLLASGMPGTSEAD